MQKELLDLFDINEQTLNTEGLQVTTTIDPKAQSAAEEAVTDTIDGQNPDMRSAVVSIDPKTGGVKAYYGGSDAQGFDFAQAGLPTGSSFKVFALVAALEQGIGLGYQVDSSPLEVNGIKITNVEGEGCGTCNIAEALKRSLNTAYYRLMLKLKNGPVRRRQGRARGRHRRELPRCRAHPVRGRQGRSAEQRNRVGPVPDSGASTWPRRMPRIAASGVYHRPHFVQKVVNADGQVLFDAATEDNSGEQRIDKAVADNVTSAMQPIAGVLQRPRPGGRSPVGGEDGHQPARRHRRQQGRLDGRLHAVAVDGGMGRHDRRHPAAGEQVGSPVYGSGLPSDIWKDTMDGALKGTDNESFPKPTEIGGYAGVPAAPPPPPSTPRTAIGDGDPADHRSGAGHHDPVRVRRRRCPAGPPGQPAPDPNAVGAPGAPVAPGVPGPGPQPPPPPP